MNKYTAILKSKLKTSNPDLLSLDIDSFILEDERKAHACHLIAQLAGASEWFEIETLRQLSCFIEYDFVKKALMKRHKEASSKKVKDFILSIYNEEVDTSDIDELTQKLEKIYKKQKSEQKSIDISSKTQKSLAIKSFQRAHFKN